MPVDKLSGPIPGENYTSDTKNYPWHRPPEHTNLDKAMDDIIKKVLAEESTIGILTMLENGMSIVDLTQIFLMSGIEKGKWTLDFALLLAGPTAHVFQLMSKAYGVEADLGIEDKTVPPTKAFFDAFKVKEPTKQISIEEKTSITDTVKKGFM